MSVSESSSCPAASSSARSSAKFSMMPLCTSATRPVAAEVRVGVDVVRRAVGGPAGVPDAGRRRRQRVVRDRLLEVGELAGPLVARRSCPSVDQRDPGGVVAAVLQAPQPLDDDVLRLLLARRSPRFRTWARVYRAAHPAARTASVGCNNRPHVSPRRVPQRRTRGRRPRVLAVRRARPRRLGRARARRPRARSPPRRSGGCAASATRSTSRRCEQVYLPLSRLLSLYVESRRPAAPPAGGLPAPAAAAAHAVRDRAGRLGRGRQVDHRPRAPADARALARAPQRRAGDHRRLPLPQRRARAPRASCSARASRSPTTGGRCCASSSTSSPARTRSRRRPTPTSSTTWCPTRRSWSSAPTS